MCQQPHQHAPSQLNKGQRAYHTQASGHTVREPKRFAPHTTSIVIFSLGNLGVSASKRHEILTLMDHLEMDVSYKG